MAGDASPGWPRGHVHAAVRGVRAAATAICTGAPSPARAVAGIGIAGRNGARAGRFEGHDPAGRGRRLGWRRLLRAALPVLIAVAIPTAPAIRARGLRDRCHESRLAARRRRRRRRRPPATRSQTLPGRSFFHEISDIEEGVALQSDVHKAGLHARKNPGDAVDCKWSRRACIRFFPLVIDFGECFVFDDGQTHVS